ncbi:MAG: GFA family protein [Xanthobacteraceae bacterium]|uniref:GFA family protein n=1 Tax=Pseudolabrys sp. TaxID=1960880 RepID=UPI003D09FF7D
MRKTYHGGCQCGAVRYDVTLELGEVISCNCSRCGRLGSLLAFAPAQDFKLTAGDKATTEYLFNKHAIHHLFCSTCGIQSFARGNMPDGSETMAINVRCLDDVDVGSLTVKAVNGRSY